MMIKFYAGGASGVETAAYLEKATDHKGRPRAAVDVLRGNPHLVGQIADSLSFKHRTTSGLIAWAPDDNPSQADIDEVLDDFERLAWAGLEPDRYAWCAVRHNEEGGGVHVHVLAARVDLETGKSLNIAPPGWQHAFDPLRDVHNIRHNWARPDDPARAQDVQLGHLHRIDADKFKSGLSAEEHPQEAVTQYLNALIDSGDVHNRDDVLSKLGELGQITRAGKHYISLKPDGANKAMRLKGGLYADVLRLLNSPARCICTILCKCRRIAYCNGIPAISIFQPALRVLNCC